MFYSGAASFPWRSHAAWFIKQMQRWNQIGADVKPEGTHQGSWTMPVAQQALTMGPDRFFDGATFEV